MEGFVRSLHWGEELESVLEYTERDEELGG